MGTAAATIGLTAIQLAGVGFCLGLGFWASKKVTGYADRLLFEYDRKEVERFCKETAAELK